MKNHFQYPDEEEKELMESAERGEWKRTDNFDDPVKSQKLRHSGESRSPEYAENTGFLLSPK